MKDIDKDIEELRVRIALSIYTLADMTPVETLVSATINEKLRWDAMMSATSALTTLALAVHVLRAARSAAITADQAAEEQDATEGRR